MVSSISKSSTSLCIAIASFYSPPLLFTVVTPAEQVMMMSSSVVIIVKQLKRHRVTEKVVKLVSNITDQKSRQNTKVSQPA